MGCLLYRLILKCKHVFIVHIGKSKMFPLPQITDVVLQWKVNLLPMGGHGVVDIFCYQFICFVLCALCILNMLKFNPVCSVSVKFFFCFTLYEPWLCVSPGNSSTDLVEAHLAIKVVATSLFTHFLYVQECFLSSSIHTWCPNKIIDCCHCRPSSF